MNDEESSQSAELNADHGDIDPSFGAGLGGFIIAHQSPLAHQPRSTTQRRGNTVKPAVSGGAFDDLGRQFG